MQLQLAARDCAARELYEQTGMDLRDKVDRLSPAVLRMNPPVDPSDGSKYLKNEYEELLFYFLSVDEADFVLPEGDEDNLSDPNGESGTKVRVRN